MLNSWTGGSQYYDLDARNVDGLRLTGEILRTGDRICWPILNERFDMTDDLFFKSDCIFLSETFFYWGIGG